MDDIGSHGLAGEAADFGESYAIPRNRGPPSAARACGAGPGNQPPLRRGPDSPTETVRRALLVAAVSIQSARDPDARGILPRDTPIGHPYAPEQRAGGHHTGTRWRQRPLGRRGHTAMLYRQPTASHDGAIPSLEYCRQPLAKSTLPRPAPTSRTNHEARAATRGTFLTWLRYAS